jgi:hypothetical protein
LASLLAVMLPVLLQAQGYPRRRAPGSPGPLGSYKGVAGTFHGKLKSVSSKEIEIQNADDQLVTIRRSGKTKFFKNEKQIKPSEIEPETAVTIEAVEDMDLSILAVTVTVDPPPKKADGK